VAPLGFLPYREEEKKSGDVASERLDGLQGSGWASFFLPLNSFFLFLAELF
jgi:hypothetical protein